MSTAMILHNDRRLNQDPPEPQKPPAHFPSGAAGERLELLKLRESTNPVVRVLALFACQVLRRLDDIAGGQGVEQ